MKGKEPDAVRPMRRLKALAARGFYLHLNPQKKQLIDLAFNEVQPRPRSFADLGSVWRVQSAYTFFTLDIHRPERAVHVDLNFTDEVLRRLRRYQNLETIVGSLGDPAIVDKVGQVDIVYLFDVLLHQVKPDWDEVLRLYAPNTSCFAIYNQQNVAFDRTVRLLDLSDSEYWNNVPQSHRSVAEYERIFEKLDESCSLEPDRTWRDSHSLWQWGITDRDLCKRLETLGFQMKYYRNCGRFQGLANVENHMFLFKKSGDAGGHSCAR